MMNRFRQHIPAFVDIDHPAAIEFETTADLLALEVVQRYKGHTHSHFAMSDNTLMEISDDGYHWWVVGFIEKPAEIDLPKWDGGKYLARLSNGREVVLSKDTEPHVTSSCDTRLWLSDGTIAVDVRRERQKAQEAIDRGKRDRGICPSCDVAYTVTVAPTSWGDGSLEEVNRRCPQCHYRDVSWRKRHATS